MERNTHFPSIYKLITRICVHRSKCPEWQKGDSCFDCHEGYLTNIEIEIEKGMEGGNQNE